MTHKVLDIGNCDPDHSSIKSMITKHFDAELLRAHKLDDALELLNQHSVDLILVNRKLDIDYSDGMDVIKSILSEKQYESIPIMLVTNFEEHQQAAVDIGATKGFGKSSLNAPETHQLISAVLPTVEA